MSPIKVLHVVSVDRENYYLRNLAEFTDAGDIEHIFVTFAAVESAFAKDMQRSGRRVHSLGIFGRKQYPKAYRELGKVLTQENPNIVHTHLFDPSLLGLTVAKRQGRRTVYTRHHSDAIHEISSATKRKIYLSLESYASRKADHIIAPSKMVWDYLVEREGVPKEKVSIIPYGQTTERFDSVTPEQTAEIRSELKMDGHLSIVNVSRLFNRKGHIYLFEALSELVKDGLDARLYLVGDGNFRDDLKRMCSELGIGEHVKFLGWRDDALAIVAAADIVVHPSLEDALSSAVIEAVMLEKPVVATDISGVRDSLGNGSYGTIVPPSNVAGLRRGIRTIVNDLEGAKARAVAGRSYLLEYMDAQRVADEHSKLYRNLLEA